jgi:hypothetical protein
MKVRKPTFEQYQAVTLHWNSHDYPTTIIQRLFDPDREQWLYRVNLREFIELVTISNLSPR